MKKWKGWRDQYADNKYDVIIIGSGISGLTSGILLANQNKKVLILEKHFKVGGWTHTFKRGRYEWDVGIHYIGEVHKPYSYARKLFDLISDGQLEWNKMSDNYDRIIFPDKHYNFISPREQFLENMIKYFPGSEDKFLKYLNLIDYSVKNGKSYFSNKALPSFLGSLTYKKMTNNFFKYSSQTTRDVIMDIFDDEVILGVLTGQWGDHGLPPSKSSFAMHAMVVRHYLDGGNYPVGTSRRIAETAVDYLEKLGGEVYVNAGVDEIIVSNKQAAGVKLLNGAEIMAPIIISSAGVFNTYETFLRKSNNYPKLSKKLNNVNQTGSYVSLYLGLNKSAEELKLNDTNLWIYPSYNHDENVENFIKNSNSELPLVYISFPSAKDRYFIDNKLQYATIEVVTVANWPDYAKWKDLPWKNRGKEYEALKEQITQRLLSIVYKNVDGIENVIDYSELSTPLSVRNLANYSHGELYGIDHTPNRFKEKWLKPKSDIKNLFLTGQDITSVGVTSALFSGLITASAITKKNLMKELLT
jgi:all-trans-retinol 13,14-reductase